MAPVSKLDLATRLCASALEIKDDKDMPDHWQQSDFFRKLADCLIEIVIAVFYNFSSIRRFLDQKEAFEVATQMRKITLITTNLYLSLHQHKESFISWALGFIFEVMEDHLETNQEKQNPYNRCVCKIYFLIYF